MTSKEWNSCTKGPSHTLIRCRTVHPCKNHLSYEHFQDWGAHVTLLPIVFIVYCFSLYSWLNLKECNTQHTALHLLLVYLTDHSYHLPARLQSKNLPLSFIWQLNWSEDVSFLFLSLSLSFSFFFFSNLYSLALVIVCLSQAANLQGTLSSSSYKLHTTHCMVNEFNIWKKLPSLREGERRGWRNKGLHRMTWVT